MNDEIFRFSIVRNPELISKNEMSQKFIPVIYDDYEYFPLSEQLKTLNEEQVPLTTILQAAGSMLKGDKFVNDLNLLPQLALPFSSFLEWINNAQQLTKESITEKVEEIFEQSPGELITKIRTNKVRIADSIVVSFVIKQVDTRLKINLMDAFRVIHLLEYISIHSDSDLSSQAIAQLLDINLLLPKEIFPLPNNNEERRKKIQEENEAVLEKQRTSSAKVEALNQQINGNLVAIKELSSVYKRHLNHIASTPPPVVDTPIGSVSKRSNSIASFNLPNIQLGNLSETALKAIERAELPATADVNVTQLVKTLESDNLNLATSVASLQYTATYNFDLPSPGECPAVIVNVAKAANNFTPDTRGDVSVVGIQDLIQVRQELLSYQAGEIAHIENILTGEFKNKNHRKLLRAEEESFVEREITEETEEELQSTDRYELQSETAKTISEDTKVEAGVTVTASYGKVDIEAHGNYAKNKATEESKQTASNYAKEIVSRSVNKIKARVLERRRTARISEVEIINEHGFDNKDGTGHVRGIYRWVDKFYKAQLLNYGKRMMLEFMIPEPAAFYKFAHRQDPARSLDVEKPPVPGFCWGKKFRKLKPVDVQAHNYLAFVGMYNIDDVNPAPPKYRSVTSTIQYKNEDDSEKAVSFNATNDQISIPEGYEPISMRYRITGTNAHSALSQNSGNNRDDNILVVVTIGQERVYTLYKNEIGSNPNDYWDDLNQTTVWNDFLDSSETNLGSFTFGDLDGKFVLTTEGFSDFLPISLNGHTTLPMSISIHYSIECERTEEAFQQWQIDTFNAIMNAYNRQLAEYNEAVQALSFEEASFANIEGNNPAINREIEKEELKKFSISLITGQHFESFNAISIDQQNGGIPQPDLLDAAAEAPFVAFFEQALEWRHMTYLFYPYFWGNKKHWVDQMGLTDNDPLFQKFLRAGYARVWIPVRPSFEKTILSYIDNGGEPWIEKEVPLIEGQEIENKLSLLQEIQESLGYDFEPQPGLIKINNGEEIVTAVGESPLFDPTIKDREILINLGTYRIIQVAEDGKSIQLDRPYEGVNEDAIGYALGAKYVGEPWVVKVPTNLVYLQEDGQL